MTPRFMIALVMLWALAGPGRALAESGPHSDPEPESKWEVTITPYVWLPAVSADLDFSDGTAVELDETQIDDLLRINWFGFLQGEVRRDKWMVLADAVAFNITYEPKLDPRTIEFPGASFSDSFEKKKTFNVGGANHEIGPIDFSGEIDVDVSGFDVMVGPLDVELNLQLVMAQLMGGYRLYDVPVAGVFGGPVADEDHRRITLDAFGGGRFWSLKGWANVGVPPVERSAFDVSASARLSASGGGQPIGNLPINTPEFRKDAAVDFGDVTVPAGTPLSGGKYQVKMSEWWVDPVIGLRARGGISLAWFGGAVTWRAVGGLGWHFGERWSAELAMRALSIDRESAESKVTITLWGPQLGLTYRF